MDSDVTLSADEEDVESEDDSMDEDTADAREVLAHVAGFELGDLDGDIAELPIIPPQATTPASTPPIQQPNLIMGNASLCMSLSELKPLNFRDTREMIRFRLRKASLKKRLIWTNDIE